MKQKLTVDELKTLAKLRWKNQDDERHKLYDIERSPLEVFEELFIDSYKNGFKCYYCGRPLQNHSPYPYYAAPSVDHYEPISKGGTDDDYNLVLCCHACNITKGTLDGFLYEEFILHIKKSPKWKEMIEGWFLGRIAGKIERDQSFKELKSVIKELETKIFELEIEILELEKVD